MATILKQHGGALAQIDPSWKIESAIMSSLCGSSAVFRMNAAILALLPRRGVKVTVEKAVEDMERLQNEASTKLAPMGSQEALRHILKILKALVSDTIPDFKASATSKIVRDVVARCAFFLEHGEGANAKHGVDAYADIVKVVERETAAKKSPLDPADVNIKKLGKFRWLAGETEEKVGRILEEVDKRAKAGAKAKAKAKAKVAKPTAAGGDAASSSSDPRRDAAHRSACAMFD